MKAIFFLICFLPSLFWVSSVPADDNTCWLTAPLQDDVWVMVYDADADGNRGDVIWQGRIAAGQKIKIESAAGYIRYDYRTDPAQPYGGDVSVGCYGQRSVSVD